MIVKAILLLVFVAITVTIGIYCRKKTSNVSQFVLGGRSMGPWMTAFAYGTTYFSAVLFVGYAGQFGWKYGIAATWIGIGNALLGSLVAWLVLARRTRVMTHHLDSATMPDFFGKRYNSKGIKIAASAILFIFMIPYTASLYNGLSRIFGMAFNIDYSICIVAMAVLTAIYVIAGGYMATAINDFIQGIFMLIGIIAIIVTVLNGHGGFSEALNSLSKISDASGHTGAFSSLAGPDLFGLIGVVLLTSLGTWGLPQMVHKFYAIKDEKSVRLGTIVSTVFAIIIAGGCYFLGGFGRLYSPTLFTTGNKIVYDSIIPYILSTLPDILIGLAVILVLSASMSTLSSLVLTSSSSLTLDFIKDTIVKEMSEKKQVLIIRILLAIFILISGVLALIQYKSSVAFIAQFMGISWGALAGSFLGPFFYGLYWKRVTKQAVWASFIAGVGITLSNMLIGYIASPINAGVLAILVSLVIVPVVSFVTKPANPESIDKVFNCFKEKAVK